MTGKFITIEGIDGAGKTTAAKAVMYALDVKTTRSPSLLWTSAPVRKALKNGGPESTPLATLYLFVADMALHSETHIGRYLNDGVHVVSDRYADSTIAYQSGEVAAHVDDPVEWIESVIAPWYIEPDLTVYIDISIDTAVERMDGDEVFENRRTQERVREAYERLMERHPDRFVRVSGEQSVAEMCGDVVDVVREEIQA